MSSDDSDFAFYSPSERLAQNPRFEPHKRQRIETGSVDQEGESQYKAIQNEMLEETSPANLVAKQPEEKSDSRINTDQHQETDGLRSTAQTDETDDMKVQERCETPIALLDLPKNNLRTSLQQFSYGLLQHRKPEICPKIELQKFCSSLESRNQCSVNPDVSIIDPFNEEDESLWPESPIHSKAKNSLPFSEPSSLDETSEILADWPKSPGQKLSKIISKNRFKNIFIGDPLPFGEYCQSYETPSYFVPIDQKASLSEGTESLNPIYEDSSELRETDNSSFMLEADYPRNLRHGYASDDEANFSQEAQQADFCRESQIYNNELLEQYCQLHSARDISIESFDQNARNSLEDLELENSCLDHLVPIRESINSNSEEWASEQCFPFPSYSYDTNIINPSWAFCSSKNLDPPTSNLPILMDQYEYEQPGFDAQEDFLYRGNHLASCARSIALQSFKTISSFSSFTRSQFDISELIVLNLLEIK